MSTRQLIDAPRRYWRATEVARILGVSRSMVYHLVAAGELETVRFGPKRLRIPDTALRAYEARYAGEQSAA